MPLCSCLQVRVHTGDKKGAGTDAKVFIKLRDSAGTETKLHKLDNLRVDDHERDTVSEFQLPECFADCLTDLDSIVLVRNDAGEGASWFVDLVEVKEQPGGCTWLFPVHRWLHAHTEYRIRQYDLSLPQNDDLDLQARRLKELHAKRALYQYTQFVEDGPVQAKVLPEDEKFSEKYQFGIGSQKQSLTAQTAPLLTPEDKWTSFKEIMEAVKSTIGTPDSAPHWRSDKWFGLQRLQGVNPVLITLCTEIPDNLGVDEALLQPFLEDFTLEQAIECKKMFMVDLGIVEGIPPAPGAQICPVIALFYLNKSNDLMPVAIQLFQHKGADNPVFVPSDPPNLWLLAKMYYNNAEAQHHQSLTHLGLTHLRMEGVVICTNRNLSVSHPLFRLLAPHFLFLMNINAQALNLLLGPGQWMDLVMTVKSAGVQQLVSRRIKTWRLDKDGDIPKQIAGRGVDQASVLPYYPYRDDSCALYAIIERYVRTVVESAYSEPNSLEADHEVQQWRRELTRAIPDGGVGMQGVAGDDDKGFTSVDQVVEVVTTFISICSQGHAAVNFGQYDDYGFVPNYPTVLYGSPPTNKATEPSEQELVGYLPGRRITQEVMVMMKLLSYHGTNLLGNFEVRYLYDPVGMAAVEKLREELHDLTKTIEERNSSAQFPYKWQSPAAVPNAISI